MKSEEELIWESYVNPIKESIDDELIDDIIYYHNDGARIDEIADHFDMDEIEVKSIINKYNKSSDSDDSYLKNKYKLDKRHSEYHIGIDSNKRSDSVDYDLSDPEFEGPYGFVNDRPYIHKGRKTINLGDIGKKIPL